MEHQPSQLIKVLVIENNLDLDDIELLLSFKDVYVNALASFPTSQRVFGDFKHENVFNLRNNLFRWIRVPSDPVN